MLQAGQRSDRVSTSLSQAASTCVLEACDDALKAQPNGSIEQGIVRVVAYQTDACENECCECGYSMGTYATKSSC